MTRIVGRALLPLLLALPLAGGCRSVAIESEPGPVYAIEVYNSHTLPMAVSYTDEGGSHELGTVAARSRQRFVIAGASGTTVTISGASESGSRTARAKTVTLRTGETVPVTLD